MIDDNKKHLVLCGCDWLAERFIREHTDIQIDFCIDDALAGKRFYQWKIYKLEEKLDELENNLVVLCTDRIAVYEKTANILRNKGLKEFVHFIPHNIYGKKIALTWGNCHVEYVKSFLSYSKEFSEKYAFYGKKNLWDMKDSDFDENLFQHCDLLICQHIREKNSLSETFSSANVEKYLKKDCEIIKFPNLFGMPKFLFPQTDLDDIYVRNKGAIRWYRDKNIDECLKAGMSEEQIYEKVLSWKYPTDELYQAYHTFCEKLAVREQQCNVHIMDYIMAHLRDEKCFLDVEHPSKKILGEIANRILEKLHMERMDSSLIIPNTYGHEVITYPEVKKFFHMTWQDGDMKTDNQTEKIRPVYMDIKEYIHQYCQVYQENAGAKRLEYKFYVESEGWEKVKADGQVAGTVGKGKKVFAFAVRFAEPDDKIGIEYRVYLAKTGWTAYVRNGEICGTKEADNYIQAVQIRLVGEYADRYTLTYSVHIQRKGWSELYGVDEMAGELSEHLRLEAIKIMISNK